MKYLLLLALVGALLWWKWQGARRAPRPPAPPPATPPQNTGVPMLPCQWCQLNVPEPELVRGRLGVYCCPEHRARAEA